MTPEEFYIKLGRIERFANDLRVCYEHNITPDFMPDDEAFDCGLYAEQLCAYLRVTNNQQMMIDCCKINRHIFYRFGGKRDKIGLIISTISYNLRKIHNMALTKIWGVSREDIDKCTYYVNSIEGVCRNSTTGELLPAPPDRAGNDVVTNDAQRVGLPMELDTPRAIKYFKRAVDEEYMKKTDTGYKWLFGGERGRIARLGYFVEQVFCPNNTEKVPEQSINRLFGVSRICSAITQLHNAKSPQKWRAEIDKTIFYD